jgi:DNA polymerase-3 subunit alpha
MALIIDTETTGLPERVNPNIRINPNYKNINKYDNCRVVQLCFMLCDENLQKIETKNYIIKKNGFDINNSEFHGITNEISNNNGIDFNIVCNDFLNYLTKISHIIAHNIDFDINVLKSELFRIGKQNIIDEIDKKILFCSMINTTNIVNCNGRYPSLAKLYKFSTNNDITNAHNAEYDVINLHEALVCLQNQNKLFIKDINFNNISESEIIDSENKLDYIHIDLCKKRKLI